MLFYEQKLQMKIISSESKTIDRYLKHNNCCKILLFENSKTESKIINLSNYFHDYCEI